MARSAALIGFRDRIERLRPRLVGDLDRLAELQEGSQLGSGRPSHGPATRRDLNCDWVGKVTMDIRHLS